MKHFISLSGINNQKQNKMEKEQMIEIILQFEKELWEERNEMFQLFGLNDEGTQRIITQWCVISNLIDKLQIKEQ
jgi:DNA-binding ferritin-like protein